MALGGASTAPTATATTLLLQSAKKRRVLQAEALALCDAPTLTMRTLRSQAYCDIKHEASGGTNKDPPHRTTMQHYQICAYAATHDALTKRLLEIKLMYRGIQWAHFDTDIWTARTSDSYITINLTFVHPSTYEREYYNLATRRFNTSHVAEKIQAAIEQILHEFHLEVGVIASNNLTMTSERESFESDVAAYESDLDSD